MNGEGNKSDILASNCTLQFTVVDINNTFLLLQKPSPEGLHGSRLYNEVDQTLCSHSSQ